jgi:hypothetical protein
LGGNEAIPDHGSRILTIFRRGVIHTRLKDFYDLAMSSRHVGVDGKRLSDAITATNCRRGTTLASERPRALSGLSSESRGNIAAWGRLKRRAPMPSRGTLRQAAEDIWQFPGDPTPQIVAGQTASGSWVGTHRLT